MNSTKCSILHVCSRETIRELRDQILRLHGYDVVSTGSRVNTPQLFRLRHYALVLIDVDGEGLVSESEQLCEAIKDEKPGQPVAFVCNHHVTIRSECPNEVIRSEFNPEALVKGVQQMLGY